MKDNYVLLHGSFGNPFSNWLPWLRKELENRQLTVYTPDLPSGVGFQKYENWEKIMKCYVECGLINEDTIIFAHSIAPVFICKFLIKNKIKVKRLVFVCGFNNYLGINEEYDAVTESMYLENIENIHDYCNNIICFYSDNDPYVKYEAEKDFASKVADKEIVISGGGHLNSELGYEKFEELLEYID